MRNNLQYIPTVKKTITSGNGHGEVWERKDDKKRLSQKLKAKNVNRRRKGKLSRIGGAKLAKKLRRMPCVFPAWVG